MKKKLKYRRNRTVEPELIADILDGRVYEAFIARNFFQKSKSSDLRLTVNWNTDGVSPDSSSSTQLWPIYLIINELDPLLYR
jgi:hypothetical protein